MEKNDIELVQIYEDDWVYKKEIVKSMILKLLKKNEIYEMEYEIKEIMNYDHTKDVVVSL